MALGVAGGSLQGATVAGGIVLTALAKLLSTVGLGVLAAKRGILDSATLAALSRLVYNVLLPALLFSNVLTTFRSGVSKQLALMPLAAVAQIVTGLLFSLLMARVLKLTRRERSLFYVCASFGNSSAMPLLLCSSLFSGAKQVGSISAVSFFLLGWSPLFWSIGFQVLDAMPSASAQAQDEKKSAMSITQFLKKLVTPPLVASMSALLIGLNPFLRGLVLRTPIPGALQTLGSGYGAAAVLVLAGSLARETPKESSTSSSALRIGRLSLGLSLCRFVLLPLVVFFSVLRLRIDDSFVRFAILLQSVMPCAQNVTVMLTLQNRPNAAAVAARLLLAVYVIGVVPIALGLTLFLAASGL
ncbi:membrane transporter [Gracilaria domingensis]|nr:membrane transporter [Gracilaria domingensis]